MDGLSFFKRRSEINIKRGYGIYQIINNAENKRYIGATVDLDKRIKDHKRKLAKGTHQNKLLQQDFNENPSIFSFETLKEFDSPDVLEYYENWYITIYQTFDKKLGYNQTSYSGYSHLRINKKSKPEKIASIGTILRACRIKANLSQTELAWKLSVNQTDIAKYEGNEKEPKISLFTDWMESTDSKPVLVAYISGVGNNTILEKVVNMEYQGGQTTCF